MDHLSVSQINLHLLCSLKYRFQYVDELPKPFRPAALAFGSAFHAALDWMHKHMAGGNGSANGNGLTHERLCKIFDADWYAQGLDTKILFDSSETETNLRLLGRELLGLYFAKPQQGVVAAEVPFTVPLVDPATGKELGMNLDGFMDLITVGDAVVEFKTSAQTMSLRDVNSHLQLTAYSYAYEVLNRRSTKVLRIVDFVKARKPKMVVLETTRTKADHERFLCLAKEVLGAIRAKAFYPRAGYWCKDCEYAQQCRAWKGN